MKIHALKCGYIKVAENLIGGGGRFSTDMPKGIAAPDSKRITMPVYAYLIEHPKQGLFLIDTGLSRDISPNGVFDRKACEKVMKKYLTALYHPYVPLGMAVDEQLASMGIKPSDLEAVILTHFDADQVAGLRSVRSAKRIILSEEESFWSVRTRYTIRQVRELWDFEEAEHVYLKGNPLGPKKRAFSITDSEDIMMFGLPGHTDGQSGVLIRSGDRHVLMIADAAYTHRNWEEMIIPGFGAEKELQKKTLRWVAGAARDPGCIAILMSHDMDLNENVIEF
jgi:glyoxylase-like metal-dependent hydrolase (beta-lactamase superfamily II)